MTPAELRARLTGLRLSQAQLAQYLEVAPNTVARWERGERVPHPLMLRVMLDLASDDPALRAIRDDTRPVGRPRST